MKDLMKNTNEYPGIIFIAGMHSSGKSKLLSRIPNTNGIVLWPRLARKELFSEAQYQVNTLNASKPGENCRKLLIRLSDCLLEFRYQKEFIELNPGYFIVSDRCPLDVLSYIKACEILEWITKSETKEITDKFNNLVDLNELEYGIYLKPHLDEIKKTFSDSINLKNSRDWEIESGFLDATHLAFNDVYCNYILNKGSKWMVIEPSLLMSSRNSAMDYIKSVISKHLKWQF